MVLRACQLSHETCCEPTQRDAVPMPTTEISEEIQTQFSRARAQFSRAHVPDRPVPHLSPVAPCVPLRLTRDLFSFSVSNDFVSDGCNQGKNGRFSVALNDQSNMTQFPIHEAKAATTYVYFGPFCVQRVTKRFVEDRHEANKAMTGSSPSPVKYPKSH